MAQDTLPSSRSASLDAAPSRLFGIQSNRAKFDEMLAKVLNPVPEWRIDLNDSGQYYLKFSVRDHTHSSEGMGEGLVSLLLIIDALYDSQPNDTIVIDEPELSLHPALQRKLAALLREVSRDRQIICSTHSPYFVDIDAIANGGVLARVFIDAGNGSKIVSLSDASRLALKTILKDIDHPHALGLDAREVFFLHDKIVLVEGQEDVVIYPRIAKQVGISINGEFFGWGVGGAGNMEMFARILSDLKYEKVFGILDGNKRDRMQSLKTQFPDYKFDVINTDDVRCKRARPPREAVQGLVDTAGQLIPGNEQEARRILTAVNHYLDASREEQ